MALAETLELQAGRKQDLARRIDEVRRPEAIRRFVYDTLPEYRGSAGDPRRCRTEVIQNDGTGAATLAFEPGQGVRCFAKLYFDDSGAHAYHVLRTLWENGFGPSSQFRVCEPLGYFPEIRMLLTRAAEGQAVASASDPAALVAGARRAARWLAHLHRSSLSIGELRAPWEVFHKLMRRMAKAAASHPPRVEEMLCLLDRFEQGMPGPAGPISQTHGQFRHIHVFLSHEAATVIDLDRSRPANPAKDLAEFLHRMRTHTFKATRGQSRAQQASVAFLEEYRTQLPQNLVDLPFYWSYHTLVSLWRFQKAASPDEPDWRRMTEYFAEEFECALAGRALQEAA